MNDAIARTPDRAEVLAAAAEIVAAFQVTDTERYFAGFAPDATFVFHAEPERLDSREAYERLWNEWIAGGWRVVSCESSEQLAQVFAGGAVFSHTVSTAVSAGGAAESYEERESIVFRVDGNTLIAIHEHLSAPTAASDSEPT